MTCSAVSACMAWPTSAAVWGRASGFFWRRAWTTAAISCGTSGRTSARSGTGSVACSIIVETAVGPWNGGLPVSSV